MNRRLRIELREYAKALTAMLAGACVVVFAAACWAAKYDFFLVEKSVAQERQVREDMLNRIAISPFDEMNGEGP